LQSTNDAAVQAPAAAADLTPNQIASAQVVTTSTAKPVAKWPYVTPFFCSAYVQGTGTLGGLQSVRHPQGEISKSRLLAPDNKTLSSWSGC
jgi:hypothetical protein